MTEIDNSSATVTSQARPSLQSFLGERILLCIPPQYRLLPYCGVCILSGAFLLQERAFIHSRDKFFPVTKNAPTDFPVDASLEATGLEPVTSRV